MSAEDDANPLGVVLHMDEEAATDDITNGPPETIRQPSAGSPLARGGRFASSSSSPVAQGLSAGGLRSTPLNPSRLTRGPSEFNLRANEQQRTPNELQRTPSAYGAALQPPSAPSSPPALLVPSIQPFETDVVPHLKSSSPKPKSPKKSGSEPMFIREQSKGWMQWVPVAVALFLATMTLCMLAYVWWRVDNVERAVAGTTAGQAVGLQTTEVDNALLVASTLQTGKTEFGTSAADFTFGRPQSPTGVAASTSVVQGQDATSEAGGDLILRSGRGGGDSSGLAGDIVMQVPGSATTTGARRLLADTNPRDVVTISGSTASFRLSASSVNLASDAAINLQATKVLIEAPLQNSIHNITLIAAQTAVSINFASLPRGAVRLKGTMTSALVTLQFTGCAGSSTISTLHFINALNVDVQVPSSACRRPANVPVFDVFVRAGDTAAFTCWAGTLQCPLEGAIVSLNQRLASSGTGTTDLSPLLARLDALEAALGLKADVTALTELNSNVTAALATGLAAKADVSALTTALAAKADVIAVNASLSVKADVSTLNTGLAAKADVTAVDTALLAKADVSALAALATTASVTASLDSVTAALALKANVSDLASYATVDAVNLKANASALSTFALASDLAAKADTTDIASTYATIASVTSQIAPLAVRADVDAGLALKANVSDVSTALALKADIALLDTYASPADMSGYSTTAQTNLTIAAAITMALQTVVNTTVLDSTIAAIQDSIATVNAIKANSTTVDALAQQVSTNTADIALRATLTALTSGLGLKADVAAVTAVEQSVASLSTLKANLSTVATLETIVQTNTVDIGLCAQTSTVNSALALKADVSALDTLRGNLADGLSLKANVTDLASLATTAALTTGLQTKADLSALDEKASTDSLTSAVSTINTALATKASTTSLNALTDIVSDHTANKLSVSDFNTFQTDNTAILDSKALSSDLNMKADLAELSMYASAADLATKADISMVPKYAQIDWFYPVQKIESQVLTIRDAVSAISNDPSMSSLLGAYDAVLTSKTLRASFNQWDGTDSYDPPAI